mgnify:CR=1 FL=1
MFYDTPKGMVSLLLSIEEAQDLREALQSMRWDQTVREILDLIDEQIRLSDKK